MRIIKTIILLVSISGAMQGKILYPCFSDIQREAVKDKNLIAGSISGKVTDKVSGLGIPNVKVQLFRVLRETKTNEMGRYSFKGLKPGEYTIIFSPPHPYCCKFYKGFCKDTFIVKEGEDVVINKTLEIGGSLRGVVYKSKDIPFKNVTIKASSLHGSNISTKTNEDGSYFVGNLCPSRDYYVRVSHKLPGYSYRFITGIKIKKGECTQIKDIIFDFNDGTGIEGYVKSSVDGNPLPDVSVSISYVCATFKKARFIRCGDVETDSNGHFCMRSIKPGEYFLIITLPAPPPKHPKTKKYLYTMGELAEYAKEKTVKVNKGKMSNVSVSIEVPSYSSLKDKD